MSATDIASNPKTKGAKRKLPDASLANLRLSKGRPKGVPNKANRTLKEAAREYTTEALEALVDAVRNETGTARIQAANSILDRGYGKPSQVLAGDEDGGAIKAVHEIIMRGVRPE